MDQITERVNKLTKMWDSGGYDNTKDAILDCRDLLAKISKDNKELKSKVEKVLEDATNMQFEVDPDDPNILVDPSYLNKENSDKYWAKVEGRNNTNFSK